MFTLELPISHDSSLVYRKLIKKHHSYDNIEEDSKAPSSRAT